MPVSPILLFNKSRLPSKKNPRTDYVCILIDRQFIVFILWVSVVTSGLSLDLLVIPHWVILGTCLRNGIVTKVRSDINMFVIYLFFIQWYISISVLLRIASAHRESQLLKPSQTFSTTLFSSHTSCLLPWGSFPFWMFLSPTPFVQKTFID